MKQTSEEVLESLKKQRKGKVLATSALGLFFIVSAIALPVGIFTENRLIATASFCWLLGNIMTCVAANETQYREKIEKQIILREAAQLAAESAKRDILSSLAARPTRPGISLN